ncbi:MAG: metallophosphoesterase family protein [Dehalococcoidia bacterium]
MRIGIISDTHIPSAGPEPPAQVATAFAGVDLILHAGHVNVASCLEWLGRIAPVRSTESWLEGQGETPARHGSVEVFEIEGHTIGMAHELILRGLGDDVLPGSIGRSPAMRAALATELREIFRTRVDIVVFGYTHEAMIETHDGILLLNPGSPSLVKQQVRLGTVAILELEPGRREAQIVDLSSLS